MPRSGKRRESELLSKPKWNIIISIKTRKQIASLISTQASTLIVILKQTKLENNQTLLTSNKTLNSSLSLVSRLKKTMNCSNRRMLSLLFNKMKMKVKAKREKLKVKKMKKFLRLKPNLNYNTR